MEFSLDKRESEVKANYLKRASVPEVRLIKVMDVHHRIRQAGTKIIVQMEN